MSTDLTRAFTSDIFTIIAGSTEERVLVHTAILAQSPVFHVMTEEEKEGQTIRLPEDRPSHIRCIIAFLYRNEFYTQSECELQAQRFKSTANPGGGPSSGSSHPSQPSSFSPPMTAQDVKTVLSDANVDAGTEPFTDAEQAVAEDLAQIFMLGNKYQLPGLRFSALNKLRLYFGPPQRVVRFLHLVIILHLHI